MSLRIVVTGGRDLDHAGARALCRKLDELHAGPNGPIKRIAHGGCRGADMVGARWAKQRGVEVVAHCADWAGLGSAAGPIRNRRMLSTERPDLLVAAPGGDGTNGCKRIARGMGIEVEEVAP